MIIVRIEKYEFPILLDHQVVGNLVKVMLKLLQYKTGSLLRDLHDQRLWFLHVEGCDEDLGVTGRDLDDVVAKAHLLSFLV